MLAAAAQLGKSLRNPSIYAVSRGVLITSYTKGGEMLNDSSYRFVRDSMKRVNRHRFLSTQSKLFCVEHGLQAVRDFFSGSDIAALSCGCRRPIFFRRPEDVEAYEAARREHVRRVEIVGKNAANANGYVRTFSESGEQAVGQC